MSGMMRQRLCLRRPAVLVLLLALLGCSQKAAPRGESPTGSRGGRGSQSLDATDSPTITAYRAVWAIIIGIDEYSGGASELKQLEHAVNDARELREVLLREFGYRDENVRFLTDQQASQLAIRDAFESWLPAQGPQKDDSVLVFFAGHGLVDEKSQEGYLAAADSVAGDLRRSCVEVSWIRDRLAALPCRHKLLILDSCYSGALFQDKPRSATTTLLTGGGKNSRGGESRDGAGASMRAHTRAIHQLADYFQDQAFYGMSAGRLQPVADGEGDNRHSVFTAALLRVLRERANSSYPDHEFTFRQLAAQVEMYVASAPGSQQTPDSGALADGRGDFVFRPTVRRQTPREIGVLAEQQRVLADRMFSRTFADARRAVDAGLRSEREQRDVLALTRGSLDTYLSMCAQADISGDKSYQHVLDWKGAILARQRQLHSLGDDPTVAALRDKLRAKTGELVRAAYLWDNRPQRLEELKFVIFQREEVERELAAHSHQPGEASRNETASAARLARALPADGVFIDFLEYDHAALNPADQPPTKPERRLAAFVVKLDRSVVEVDLGPVAKISDAVAAWRVKHFGDVPVARSKAAQTGQPAPPGAPRPSTRGLALSDAMPLPEVVRDLVWRPLEKHVVGAKLVFISPDGVICRVPFAAMPAADPARYLIEDYCFVVQPVPQLLSEYAEQPLAADKQPKLLTVGDIDYRGDRSQSNAESRGFGVGREYLFGDLPGTEREIRAVARLFSENVEGGVAAELRRLDATASAFCEFAPLCRYLHVATHGFHEGPNLGLNLGPLQSSAPGIECGLAFAGVNQWSAFDVGGRILTALEVAGLDLRQTELVVLSACETAEGKTVSGEGAFGLQRAFHVAGAAPWWPVCGKSMTWLRSN